MMVRLVVLFLLALLGSCAALGLATYIEIEQRDEGELFAFYAGKQVSIIDTVEWPSYQTCFEVDVSELRPGSAVRKVVMFDGGDDRDYHFAGEYRTMAECKKNFYRG